MANYSYGGFLITPIEERLKKQGIKVVHTRVGSSEAHENEHIIAAKGKDQLLSDETLEFILKEKPIVVMVDGSNSFIRQVDARYPDSHKAYANAFLLIDYVLMGGKQDIESFPQSKLEELGKVDDAQRKAGHFKGFSEFSKVKQFINKLVFIKGKLNLDKEKHPVYGIVYWNPTHKQIVITHGGRGDSRQIRSKPSPFSLKDKKSVNSPLLIVTSVNIPDEDLPSYIKEAQNNRQHLTASIDDHIKRRWVVDKKGVRPSDTFANEFKRQFRRIEKFVQENEQPEKILQANKEEDLNLFYKQYKEMQAVLLDVDGTLKEKHKKIPPQLLEFIVHMLENGFKVGIVSGRSGSIRKILLRPLLSRLSNRDKLSNLYIFQENGAKHYQASKVNGDLSPTQYLYRYEIPHSDIEKIVSQIETALKGLNYRIDIRSSSIRIYEYGDEKDNEKEIMEKLVQALNSLSNLEVDYTAIYTGKDINIVASYINKGTAADAFSRYTGISQNKTLKLGDQGNIRGNDYPMLIKAGGIQVDGPFTTLKILKHYFENKKYSFPSDNFRFKDGDGALRIEIDYLKEEYKEKYKVAIVGGALPSLDYIPSLSYQVGRSLLSLYKERNNVVFFTGGTEGAPLDVFTGILEECAKENININDIFFVLVPHNWSYSRRYDEELSSRNFQHSAKTEYCGQNMEQRRTAISQLADVLVVVNGGSGTKDETIKALKKGKRIFAVKGTKGIADELASRKENGSLGEFFKENEIPFEYKSNIEVISSSQEVGNILPNPALQIGNRAHKGKLTFQEGKLSRVEVVDSKGNPLGNIEDLELVEDGRDKLISALNQLIEQNPQYSQILRTFLSLLQNSPPELQLYTFDTDTLIEDLFGFASAPTEENSQAPSLIALYSLLSNNPVALFHEAGEYLVKSKRLKVKGKRLVVNGKEQIQIIIIDDKTEKTITLVLTREDTIKIAKKDLNSPHYLLRALQREIFGKEDRRLTTFIHQNKKLDLEIKYKAPAGIADEKEQAEVERKLENIVSSLEELTFADWVEILNNIFGGKVHWGEYLKGKHIVVSYFAQGVHKHVFKIEIVSDKNRVSSKGNLRLLLITKKEKKEGRISDLELANLKRLKGRFTPKLGKEIKAEDGKTFYIEEFIEGKTAQQLKDKEKLTVSLKKKIISTVLSLAVLLKGSAPLDIHPENFIIKPDNSVVMVDIGDRRVDTRNASSLTHKITFLGIALATYGFLDNYKDNYFLFDTIAEHPQYGLNWLKNIYQEWKENAPAKLFTKQARYIFRKLGIHTGKENQEKNIQRFSEFLFNNLESYLKSKEAFLNKVLKKNPSKLKKGGIDLNPQNLDLKVEGSSSVNFNFKNLPFDIKSFSGFSFKIIEIKTLKNPADIFSFNR